VPTIFGVEWTDLGPDHLEMFLKEAGEEPLTWEAKADGDQKLHPASIRKAICAFANAELGGTLILGATGPDGGWRLVGLRHTYGELTNLDLEHRSPSPTDSDRRRANLARHRRSRTPCRHLDPKHP
jgi:hypothetical protein